LPAVLFDAVPEDVGVVDLIPARIVLPLSQHIGLPAIPVVKAGDEVKKGDMVAKAAEGAPSACVHTSFDGVVDSVDKTKIVILCK
jgi:Na+-translocating ferredoxin:NAD+ oxidoreductase RnfC subunit